MFRDACLKLSLVSTCTCSHIVQFSFVPPETLDAFQAFSGLLQRKRKEFFRIKLLLGSTEFLQKRKTGSILCEFFYQHSTGVSTSGKSTDFDSVMRRFESCHPSHFVLCNFVLGDCLGPGDNNCILRQCPSISSQ